jgi:hypothetical protein
MNIININSGLNLDKSLISNKNIDFQKDLKDKLESEITRDGILLKFKGKEKLIKIEGDVNNIKEAIEVEDQFGLGMVFGVLSSAFEGALKGLGVVFLNGLYPLVPAISKYIDSYKEVKEEANEMVNNGNECEVSNAALKGGILGAVKGLGDGILDLAVIGLLTALGVSVLGPIGFALAPFIGATYNLAKDDIRLKLEESKSSKVGINNESNEAKKSNKEEDPREPFFPFPPRKQSNSNLD